MRFTFPILAIAAASDLSDAVTKCDTGSLVKNMGANHKATDGVQTTIKMAPNAEAKCIINEIKGKNTLFVDVRGSKGPQEYGDGHCTSSVNIVWPSSCWTASSWEKDVQCKDFVDRISSAVRGDYTTPVVIHCVSGNRAGQVAKFLAGQDWTDSKTDITHKSTYTDTSKHFKEFVVTNGGYTDVCDDTEKGQNRVADLKAICGDTTPDALKPTVVSPNGKIEFVTAEIGTCMINTIGTKETQADAGGSVKFVDVRGAKAGEWEAGHCENSYQCAWPGDACWKDSTTTVSTDCQTFMDCMDKVVGKDFDTPVFILCKSGNRAGQVARFLQGSSWFDSKCDGSEAECTFASARKTSPFTNFVVSEANGGTACPAGGLPGIAFEAAQDAEFSSASTGAASSAILAAVSAVVAMMAMGQL